MLTGINNLRKMKIENWLFDVVIWMWLVILKRIVLIEWWDKSLSEVSLREEWEKKNIVSRNKILKFFKSSKEVIYILY